MLMCLKCGKLNQPDENYCSFCGASLPKLAYTMEMAAVDENMDLYFRFQEVTDLVRNGEMPIEGFETFLNDMSEKLQERDEDLRNFFDQDIDEEIKDDFVEEFSTGFQGLDMIADAIDSFYEYLDDEKETHLDKGLELFEAGLKLVHKARRINREREKLLNMNADYYRSESAMEL